MPVRVGVIGCGTIAYWAHLRTLRRLPGAVFVAAADPDPAARARAATLVSGRLYEHAADLLQHEGLDAVVISAPPLLHAPLTMAAAEARKHVYVEKPLATTACDARASIAAVARAGVIGTVGFNFRRHPAHERARALLRSGSIGTVRAVQSAFCEPARPDAMPAWKRQRGTGGGALLDLASHHVDLLRWLLEDEIVSVEARIDSLETEHDTGYLTLTFESGAVAQTYVTFRAGPADFLEIIGDRGTLRTDRHATSPTLRVVRSSGYGVRRVWESPTPAGAALWLRTLAQPSYQPSFRRALAAFVDRVNGRPVTLPGLEDGWRSLEVVLAAEESARRGVRIPLGSPLAV